MLFKRGASHVRFYTPMVSRGFAYGLWQMAVFVVAALEGWKSLVDHGVLVTDLHRQILYWGCLATFLGAWFGYTDKTKAEFDSKKKIRDEETSQTRLKTLG